MDIFGEEKLVLGIEEISNGERLIAKFNEMQQEEVEIRNQLKKAMPRIQKCPIAQSIISKV